MNISSSSVLHSIPNSPTLTLRQPRWLQARSSASGVRWRMHESPRFWSMVHVVSLQRVREPTNIQVRRLIAITRNEQTCPKKIVYQAMNPRAEVDLHSDSGYRRLSGDADDDVKGYGTHGANLLRRGDTSSGKPVVHLVDARCNTRRLQVRSSYSAETQAAAHNLE
eukprot:4613405-Pyramimonas_sp.AAC.1